MRLTDYQQYGGVPETGTVRNVLAYQGVTMPHTGEAPSHALCFGLSGGVVAGYFTFEYQGELPYLHFLTRNTFDPMDTLVKRLNVPVDVKQTDNPDRAEANLVEALRAGQPVIAWVVMQELPYNGMSTAGDPLTLPLVVTAYDPEMGSALVSDRARVPMGVTVDQLAAARLGVKRLRHRQMTLGAPNLDDLPQMVEAALRQTIEGFVGEPPRKPMRNKYGLAAYDHWSDLLDANQKEGWPKKFAPGPRLLSGLISAYFYTNLAFTAAPLASRSEYADFLDEAAAILQQPAFESAADAWRTAAEAWEVLNDALLPRRMPPFDRLRDLMDAEHRLFIEQGADSLEQRASVHAEFESLKAEMGADFPLGDAGVAVLLEAIRESLHDVRSAEAKAIQAMQSLL